MSNHPNRSKIARAVSQFFGAHRVAYATPGTDNHSANFYGDTYICKLSRREVVACIETARDNWCVPDHSDGSHDASYDPENAEQSAIRDVLEDLQFDRPD